MPNTSDTSSRYRFSSQPAIGQWNIGALASLFIDLVPTERLQQIVASFTGSYDADYKRLLARKLGFSKVTADDEELVRLLRRGSFFQAWEE